MSKEFYRHIEFNFDPINHEKSWYKSDNKFWHLSKLIQAVKDQKVKKEKIYINSMHHPNRWKGNTMNMAESIKRINKANTKMPVIIDWDWYLIDWYHRIVKCILENKTWIWAYRIVLDNVECEEDKDWE